MPFPVSTAEITATEKSLGAGLPERYRASMVRCNGGHVEARDDTWQLHPLEDKTDRRRATRTANHIVRETREARKWPNFPPDAISIASNGTGDLLVLRQWEGVIHDTVYLWSHAEGNLTELAQSIDQLRAR
jgi:hypothetical protein